MQSIGKSLKSAYKICEPDYPDNHAEELDELMIKVNFGKHEKADRGSYQHNYHRAYGKLLGPDRYKIKNVLECGIWVGLGLLTWARYFPNCMVDGIDKQFQHEDLQQSCELHPGMFVLARVHDLGIEPLCSVCLRVGSPRQLKLFLAV